MVPGILLLAAMLPAQPDIPLNDPAWSTVQTRFIAVWPFQREDAPWQKSLHAKRAVVLIAGLKLHPIFGAKALLAQQHDWQEPDSQLVRLLNRDSDVYSYCYGQNMPLMEVHRQPGLKIGIARLKKAGYQEIVLLGHSAGGLVSRMFVEDFPDAGVTKVIQVCSPNAGTNLAKFSISVRKEQAPFLDSLTREARARDIDVRQGRVIPKQVQFVSVVGIAGALGTYVGDGVVAADSQWSEDLQRQGIPATRVVGNHHQVVRTTKTTERLADLVREEHARWSESLVRARRADIFSPSRN